MKLIDADELIEVIKKQSALSLTKGMIEKFIKSQKTAYDVDNVVEQLEKCKEIMDSPISRDCFEKECACSDCTVCCFNKAIEIVKAGGANGT